MHGGEKLKNFGRTSNVFNFFLLGEINELGTSDKPLFLAPYLIFFHSSGLFRFMLNGYYQIVFKLNAKLSITPYPIICSILCEILFQGSTLQRRESL